MKNVIKQLAVASAMLTEIQARVERDYISEKEIKDIKKVVSSAVTEIKRVGKEEGVEVFARVCDYCHKGMNEGYLIEDDATVFCSRKCIDRHLGGSKVTKELIDEEVVCYTAWEDPMEWEYLKVGGDTYLISVGRITDL